VVRERLIDFVWSGLTVFARTYFLLGFARVYGISLLMLSFLPVRRSPLTVNNWLRSRPSSFAAQIPSRLREARDFRRDGREVTRLYPPKDNSGLWLDFFSE